MGAKVRNFYIFDTDEIDIEESTLLPVHGQRGTLLLFALPLSLVFFPKTIYLQANEQIPAAVGLFKLSLRWDILSLYLRGAVRSYQAIYYLSQSYLQPGYFGDEPSCKK